MIEGWHGDDHLILFDEEESADLSLHYNIAKYIGAYRVVGLLGWDDFILQGHGEEFVTIPTVPLDLKHLAPLKFKIDRSRIRPDERYWGKIKWYITPVVFGGDPAVGKNMTWVSIEQHVELVKWWNGFYRNMK